MLNLWAKRKSFKVLDSSVFIDGRILDVLDTGWFEGDIIIPQFVLTEMQTMFADSKHHDKRQKGKKGLNVALEVQQKTDAEIWEKEIKGNEVDLKLVFLSKELNAKLLTLDSNLQKVAKIHAVPVLNIHELYLALKPKLVRGQEIFIKIKDKGKEVGQGRGDYEDIMIVVDGASKNIGKRVKVEIRDILNTQAGSMAFAKLIDG